MFGSLSCIGFQAVFRAITGWKHMPLVSSVGGSGCSGCLGCFDSADSGVSNSPVDCARSRGVAW